MGEENRAMMQQVAAIAKAGEGLTEHGQILRKATERITVCEIGFGFARTMIFWRCIICYDIIIDFSPRIEIYYMECFTLESPLHGMFFREPLPRP
jgi:acetone carboxylase gamma subunit